MPDQRASEMMRVSLAHPNSIKPQTPAHNPHARVGFAHQETGRFDKPKPPPPGAFAVPGPGYYSGVRKTRRGADTLTNSAKPTFGTEEQRPDVEKMSERSPGPGRYDTVAANIGRHSPPKFSMSPRVWAEGSACSPRMKPYEPPLGQLPAGFGKQVEGERTTAPSCKFTLSPQRPGAVGAAGSKQFLGKDLEFASRGAASVQVPNYVTHQSNGLYRSPKQANAVSFGFCKESRF